MSGGTMSFGRVRGIIGTWLRNETVISTIAYGSLIIVGAIYIFII